MELQTKVKDLDSDVKFAYIWYIVFVIICGITFLILLYITIQVIKRVGSTDKIIPAMMIML